jgi:hypothetical protein
VVNSGTGGDETITATSAGGILVEGLPTDVQIQDAEAIDRLVMRAATSPTATETWTSRPEA